jgi:hypothetical protein
MACLHTNHCRVLLQSSCVCRYGLDLNSAAKGEMQVATRQGNGADLNVWVTSINFFGVIGWVSNPVSWTTTARTPYPVCNVTCGQH